MPSSPTETTDPRDHQRLGLTPLLRGSLARCPACGRASVLHHYLKVRETCPACGTRFGHLRVDDGAAWLALSLVGLVVFPALMYAEIVHQPPVAATIAVAVAATALLTLLLLPVSKGLILAVLWGLERRGDSVPDQ